MHSFFSRLTAKAGVVVPYGFIDKASPVEIARLVAPDDPDIASIVYKQMARPMPRAACINLDPKPVPTDIPGVCMSNTLYVEMVPEKRAYRVTRAVRGVGYRVFEPASLADAGGCGAIVPGPGFFISPSARIAADAVALLRKVIAQNRVAERPDFILHALDNRYTDQDLRPVLSRLRIEAINQVEEQPAETGRRLRLALSGDSANGGYDFWAVEIEATPDVITRVGVSETRGIKF